MTWERFGFSSTSSIGGGSTDLKTNQIPLTYDFVNWTLPVGARKIVPGTLVVFVNGLAQYSNEDFRETSDGKGFEWISPEQLDLDYKIRCMYVLN